MMSKMLKVARIQKQMPQPCSWSIAATTSFRCSERTKIRFKSRTNTSPNRSRYNTCSGASLKPRNNYVMYVHVASYRRQGQAGHMVHAARWLDNMHTTHQGTFAQEQGALPLPVSQLLEQPQLIPAAVSLSQQPSLRVRVRGTVLLGETYRISCSL